MTHEAPDRPLLPALRRGFRGRCPRCGEGAVFQRYLAFHDACSACDQDFSGHQSDDMPPWLTILVTGHVLAPLILFVELELSPPVWVSYALWPSLVLVMSFLLLPRIKGAVLAFQWAKRMHGFADSGDVKESAGEKPWAAP
ncbi:MAG: DUF983 domain-containing protein [Pseudomonadota bacterium]